MFHSPVAHRSKIIRLIVSVNKRDMVTCAEPKTLPGTRTDVRDLEALYVSAFPGVARFVSRRGGTFQDAKDIFQDALLVHYEKSAAGTHEITATPEAYIMGVARHLWIRRFNRDRQLVPLDELETRFTIPADFDTPPEHPELLGFLERAGKKCLELLSSFYYEGLGMKAISERFGYRNERTATVAKFKCMEKVRDVIKQKSAHYEDFIE